MKINARGLRLIKDFEGLELTGYLCPAGIPTIGYGSTGKHVKVGAKISEGEADELLLEDLERFEIGVARAVAGTPTTDNQFSAMVCLAFNIGMGNPKSDPPIPGLLTSTVLKRHKLGNRLGASRAFLMWNKAKGQVLRGLVRRREAEAELYMRPA
jgi:lysozyme